MCVRVFANLFFLHLPASSPLPQDSEFAGGDGGVDLYDDVMAPPSSQGESNNRNNSDGPPGSGGGGGGGGGDHRQDRNNSESSETNGGPGSGGGGGGGGGSNYHNHHSGNSNMSTPSYPGRRHQLYIGNLTWVSEDRACGGSWRQCVDY